MIATLSRRRAGAARASGVTRAVRRVVATGAVALGVAAFTGLLVAGAARAQTLNPSVVITNGQISAQVLRDQTLYVGGSFSFVGPVTGAGVPVDTTTGLP